ncbi:MAG: polymer-forming cytoskeletal protein [Cytophagales bacterium]|nr:polymer-forming cytoskeletal protein [Cytophagales bacterium]
MFNNKKEDKMEPLPTNIIGKGSLIKGDFSSEGNLRLEGTVEGNMSSKAKIVLGETGLIIGDVVGKDIEIQGRIEGNVRASENLTLRASADIAGNIQTKKLIVESGAVFHGHGSVGKVGERGIPSSLTLPREKNLKSEKLGERVRAKTS